MRVDNTAYSALFLTVLHSWTEILALSDLCTKEKGTTTLLLKDQFLLISKPAKQRSLIQIIHPLDICMYALLLRDTTSTTSYFFKV